MLVDAQGSDLQPHSRPRSSRSTVRTSSTSLARGRICYSRDSRRSSAVQSEASHVRYMPIDGGSDSRSIPTTSNPSLVGRK